MKVCYDVKVDPCKSEVSVVIPIELRGKQVLPMKHYDTVEDAKGDIDIYMPVVPPALVQVSQTDIEKLKYEAEVAIEGAWNHKRRLKGAGHDIQMTFDVQFVEAGGNPCHIVYVLPGEGRSSTEEWYLGDWDLSYTAHEFGHYMGLDDEYKDRECPKRPKAADENIMAGDTTPMERHFKPVADWASKATKTSYKITPF